MGLFRNVQKLKKCDRPMDKAVQIHIYPSYRTGRGQQFTARRHFDMFQSNMILNTALQWLKWSLTHQLKLENTPHISSQVSYGVSLVSILEKKIQCPHTVHISTTSYLQVPWCMQISPMPQPPPMPLDARLHREHWPLDSTDGCWLHCTDHKPRTSRWWMPRPSPVRQHTETGMGETMIIGYVIRQLYTCTPLCSQVFATHAGIGQPLVSATTVQSANDLLWLCLNVGHHDSSPSSGLKSVVFLL